MTSPNSTFWNSRYSQTEYAYGTNANQFLIEALETLSPGRILLPCDGEGRNAVYAASKGWTVEAFDLSEEGRKKALSLAKEKNVSIHYSIADANEIDFPPASFDVIALIYSHFPAAIRKSVHRKMTSWLRPGGMLILEAFHPAQLANSSGGPQDISMLYTEEMLHDDFAPLLPLQLSRAEITLNEGKYHQGVADVIRLIALKPAD
jgi:SAM-dependent methyltransferase